MRTNFGDIAMDDDVWNNVTVTMTGVKGGGVKDPTFVQVANDGEGSPSTGIFGYSFSATAEEELFFTLQAPFSYKEGSNVHPHIHWMPNDTDTGTVVWGLEVAVVNEGAALGNTGILTTTANGGGLAYEHIISEWPEMDGSNFEFNSTMMCRIFRDATADTYTGEAILLLMDFNHLMDTVGSDTAHFKTPGKAA